jgi:site-specific recombinase XerD
MHYDDQNLTKFAAELKLAGKLDSTIESYCRDARRFLNFLGENGIALGEVEASALTDFQKHLHEIEHGKENSVRRTVIGVRQFFRFLRDQKTIQDTPFDAVSIPYRLESKLSHEMMEQIAEMVSSTTMQSPGNLRTARDSAILCLMALEGIKANELLELAWSDLLESQSLVSLRIPGMRGRIIELSRESAGHLLIYRSFFVQDPRIGRSESPELWRRIFISFKGRDSSIPIPSLSRHGLKFIIYELGERFKIDHLNSELLRHHAVDAMLERGVSPESIMVHLGLRRIGNIKKHLGEPRKPADLGTAEIK